jgi:hypothetical protein
MLLCMYFNTSEKLNVLLAEPSPGVCSVLTASWRVLNSTTFLHILLVAFNAVSSIIARKGAILKSFFSLLGHGNAEPCYKAHVL